MRLRSFDFEDVGSEQFIFINLQGFYTYITLKSKYSSSSKTLKNKPELLKDIENFSNAYFNRVIRYMHAKDTHIDDDHKKEIREHILSAVMAFVISEDRLPTSNEEIMSTLYLSMPIDDLERIAKDLQNYSMLTNEFSGIKFSKNDFEKNLRCLSPLFSFGLGKGAHFSDIAADYKGGVPMYKHLISSYSCQYIDIKYKGGMITATSPGWDNKIGSKDDIVIFEYEGDKILSYISEFKESTSKKKLANDNDSNTGAADVKAIAAPVPTQAAPTIQAAPSPAPTPNHNASNTEKRCDTQTISNEKHLPKWNIEIIDSSVITSMLKDAEKTHLPFLKINASDNLKQKLEDYINKNPSKLHKDSQNAFTCEPGNYIKTASNIGIQLVSCNDNKMSVVFLNLVSPVDNKARVYTAKTFDHLFEDAPVITKTEETVINGERGAYVAVKYEIYYEGAGHERSKTDIVHYLFLGDKLRFLSDWNAFHIEENWYYEEDGTEDYSCDAKTTVLRLENSEVKHIYSTPNSTRPDSWPNQFHDNVPAVHTNHRERHQIMPVYNAEECKFYKDAKLTPDAKTAPKNLSRFLKSFNPSFYEYAIQRFIENPITVTRTAKTCTLTLDGECYYYEQFFLDSDCSVSISEKNAFITVSDAQKYQLNKGDVFPTCLLDSKKSNKSGTECQGKFKSNSYWQVLEDTPRTIYQWSQGTDIEECNEVTDKVIFVYDQEGIETRRALYNEIELGMQNLNQLCQ